MLFSILSLANLSFSSDFKDKIEDWERIIPVVDWGKGTVDFYKSEKGKYKNIKYDGLNFVFPNEVNSDDIKLLNDANDLRKKEIIEVSNKLSAIDVVLSENLDTVGYHDKQIKENKGKIDVLAEVSSGLIDSTENNAKEIKANLAAINENGKSIKANSDDIKFLNDANDLRKKDIIEVSNKLSVIDVVLSENLDTVGYHDKQIKENKGKIDVLAEVSSGLIDSTENNAKEIKANLATINENGRQIKENGILIDTALQIGAANAKAIKGNSEAIKENSEKLDSGLAEVAALSGLLQPSTPNKGIISAAFGGHNKAVAFSIGGGYNLGNGLAIKGAASTSYKFNSVSYNLGVGYEF